LCIGGTEDVIVVVVVMEMTMTTIAARIGAIVLASK
jgi:hypothetical protein